MSSSCLMSVPICLSPYFCYLTLIFSPSPFFSTPNSITRLKAFGWVDHNKLWQILKEMEIPDHLTCLMRNLYVGQEATVITGRGTMDWFQFGKGVHQGYILSPCLFNLYTEYIMQNARLEEAQAGIKIGGRNISNLSYADDTSLMGESEEELKSLWWKWKRRVKKLA